MQAGQAHGTLCHILCHGHAEPNTCKLDAGLHEMAMSVLGLLMTSQEEYHQLWDTS